ncbi:MAG: recombination protein NinG [Pseudomonadota bacterium]
MTRCSVCRSDFVKRSMTHKACSPSCAETLGRKVALEKAEKAKRAEAKRDRLDTRERKEKLKTKSDYTKDTQTAFNAYIRFRDKEKPCICCGLPLASGSVGGLFDCGHYRSVGSAPHLRFDERNAHGQRKQCNRYGSGRAVDYRVGLIKRIGLDSVESLESDNRPRHYTKEDLQGLKACFRNKLKELKKGVLNV